MSRSLAIAFICSLGFVAFTTGCKSDDENPPGNSAAGSTGGTDPTGGTGATSGGGAGGESGASGQGGGEGGAGGGGAGGAGGEGGAGGGQVGDGKSWTHLGYDQTNTYFNPGETKISVESAPTLVEKWVFPTAGTPHGGLSIAEGKVFASTLGGTYAIDLATGEQVWHKPAIVADSTATYDNGAVYVHTQGSILYKLNAADGETIWMSAKTYDIAGSDGTSSPTVGGGFVVVGHSAGTNEVGAEAAAKMSKGGVEAFDTETGERAWTYQTCEGQEDGAMTWSTVSIDLEAGIVFAATGNNYTVEGANSDSIHAIELATGELVWKTQVRAGDQWSFALMNSQDTDFGANPILATIGDRKVVANGDKGSAFWVLDRMTGEEIWSNEALSSAHSPANGGVLNNGAFDGHTFYLASNQPPTATRLHALAADGGAAVWPAKDFPVIVWGMSSVANGVLAVPLNTELVLFNAATGDELKRFETGGTIAAGAPAIADGMIVVKSGMSYIFAFADATNNSEIHAYGLP